MSRILALRIQSEEGIVTSCAPLLDNKMARPLMRKAKASGPNRARDAAAAGHAISAKVNSFRA
jgi:hypothetical protein